MRRLQFLACSLVLGLAACGGGGGGGSSPATTTTSANTNTFPPQVPITYTGVNTAASVSANNAGMISANVVGASGAAGGSIVVSAVAVQGNTTTSTTPQPTGATGLSRRLSQAMRSSDIDKSYGGVLAGAAINTTTPCDSGTMQVSGTTAANGTGTVNIAYNNCRTGSDTINGPASLRIDSFDQANNIITDGTLTMTRVDFSGPGMSFGLTGTLRSQIDVGAATTKLTTNIVTQDGAGHQMRTQDLIVTNTYDDVTSPSFFTESVSGRVFDSTSGYVDVSTQTAPFTAPWGPLYFSTSTQSFPDWGIITLTGATSSVKLTSFGSVAKIEVDANGDGTIDNTARMQWSDFNTAVGADLADSDGDGMHNSFETFYGLNPNSAADKDTDADGDGASNYTEYLAGANPATNGSVPSPVRHLWVTDNRDLAVDASGQIQVFVGPTGSGILLDPVTRELGAAFSGVTEPNTSTQTTSVADAQGRTFTLTPTAVPTSWTITSSTGATFTVTGVAGTNPGSLIRYGAHGIAFRTVGASGAGYIYLVESTTLVP